MKKSDAKKLIWKEWAFKRDKINSGNSMFAFFLLLQKEKPELLKFRCSGDPWQTIHAWLIDFENKNS